MNNIKKILVPVDFTPASEMALQYVANILRKEKEIQVLLLYISNSASEKSFEKKIEQLESHFPEKITENFEWIKSYGDLIPAILELQEWHRVNLIIMGTKGNLEADAPASTNTSKLVMEADCPVLVIPESSQSFQLKKIALALGNDPITDHKPLGTLFDLARIFDAQVHVLTVERGSEQDRSVQKENDAILEYYLEMLFARHVFKKNADLEEGIFNYVKEQGIDMLAILPKNHAKKTEPSEGRLTQLLTLHTEVPLLTID